MYIYILCVNILNYRLDTLMGLIFARTNFRELENFTFREDLFSRMSCFTIFREDFIFANRLCWEFSWILIFTNQPYWDISRVLIFENRLFSVFRGYLFFANRTSSNFSRGLNFANLTKIRENSRKLILAKINPIKVFIWIILSATS